MYCTLELVTKLPREGYKSITVPARVYKILYNEYMLCKDSLAAKQGIRSFSGYVTYRIGQLVDISEEKPRFVMRNHDDRGVKVWDEEIKEHAHVQITPKGIYCTLCDASRCEHVRFALTQSDVRQIIKQKGWRIELPDV